VWVLQVVWKHGRHAIVGEIVVENVVQSAVRKVPTRAARRVVDYDNSQGS
jgi:hypothetical protein